MNATRREFLLGMLAGGTAFNSALSTGLIGVDHQDRSLAAAEVDVLDAARQQAARRRRRVIFNNDGDDIWAAGATTLQKFLDVRHTPLLNTHVDSIFYCTTQSFNYFTHDTQVAELFTSREGQFANNNLIRFLGEKTDGLRMSSRFARQHGLESIWTLRMNDIHDAWTPAFRPKWKQADPKRVMSTLEKSKQFKDRRRLWSLVDFEHPDVEPRLVAIIEEVLKNYDIDGVELDFLRAPFYFRTSYEGRPVTHAQAGILTQLVRRIRDAVVRLSKQRRRPFLLAVRVPSTPLLCRKIGIDIKSWLQEQLIDVMALGGGYVTFDVPVKVLIALGHEHGIPVYPCLSQSGLMHRPPRGTSTKQPPEAWFGASARLWADGADGIYTFNLFPGPGTQADRKYARNVLQTIGSTDSLAKATKMHSISDAGWWMPSHYWSKDAADFSKALPLPLKANEFLRTSMYVADDLRGAGFDVTAELRVDFTGLADDSSPHILFGSANFGRRTDGNVIAGVRRFACPVPISAIKQGPNRVMVKTAASGAQLAGAELWIKRS